MNGFRNHKVGEFSQKEEIKKSHNYRVGLVLFIPVILGYLFVSVFNKEQGIYKAPEPTFESIQLTGHNQNGSGSVIMTGATDGGNASGLQTKDGNISTGNDWKDLTIPRPNQSKKTKTSGTQPANQVAMVTEVEKGEILAKVGAEVGIDPVYFRIIGYSESLANLSAKGDGGCSLGAYQFNKCAGNGRENQVWFGKKFVECANDLTCSTKMLAEKMRTVYDCKITNGEIEDYRCLYKHQGISPSARYKATIDKNYLLLFSKA